jgi:hypothetical protein
MKNGRRQELAVTETIIGARGGTIITGGDMNVSRLLATRPAPVNHPGDQL